MREIEKELMQRQKVKRKQKDNDKKEEIKTQKLNEKKKYVEKNKLKQRTNMESWNPLGR